MSYSPHNCEGASAAYFRKSGLPSYFRLSNEDLKVDLQINAAYKFKATHSNCKHYSYQLILDEEGNHHSKIKLDFP